MPMRVRTASSNQFWRCGLRFTQEWTIVDDEKLRQKFPTPQIPRKTKDAPTVAEVLRNERMLVCEDVPEGRESKKKSGDERTAIG